MGTSHLYISPPSPNELLSKGYRIGDQGLSPCIIQNARLYLAETTRLFTQLWASVQSGEADGGVNSHARQGMDAFHLLNQVKVVQKKSEYSLMFLQWLFIKELILN